MMRGCVMHSIKGGSLAEYGLIAGLISVAAIGSLSGVGILVEAGFDNARISLDSAQNSGGGVAPVPTDSRCYDPSNLQKIGEAGWAGCEGMYIVTQAEMDSIGAYYSGDASYQVVASVDGQTYTIDNSARNIFTGQVTDMSGFFSDPLYHMGDSVTPSFSGDASYLDMSNVTEFDAIFAQNTVFNGDIGSWDVSSATSMANAFYGSAIDQDLSQWNVGSVLAFSYMFEETSGTSYGIGGWTVTSADTMDNMFLNASFNEDISGWDTTGITDMTSMFQGASNFNQDLNSWNVGNVTQCANFSTGATSWTAPKPGFGTC
jgi:surface protein